MGRQDEVTTSTPSNDDSNERTLHNTDVHCLSLFFCCPTLGHFVFLSQDEWGQQGRSFALPACFFSSFLSGIRGESQKRMVCTWLRADEPSPWWMGCTIAWLSRADNGRADDGTQPASVDVRCTVPDLLCSVGSR